MRHVLRELGFPFHMGNGIVLGSRIESFHFYADFSLALLEMRVTLVRLIWGFDVALRNLEQEEPTYDHLSLSAGHLKVRLKRVERR
jgi:hypothetical protein